MPTIRQIADVAGVSVATVSYVLNDRPDVSDETRERVMAIVEKLNYVRSRTRKRSRGRNVPAIRSLAFVSCLPFDPWTDPYFGQFLKGCIEAAHQTESVVQVTQIDPEKPGRDRIPLAVRERITDGLIVTGWPSRQLMAMLSTQNIPMVLIDTRDVYEGYSHIRPDHGGGAAKAVRHLHQLGHRRIAVITGDMQFECEAERLAAYRQTMRERGLEVHDRWIVRQPLFCERCGYDAMLAMIDRGLDVTAAICHGDLVARGALTAARERGVVVPKDLSIIGCDNQPWSDQTIPALTTIDVFLQELGAVALRHLLQRVNHPTLRPQRIVLESEVVVRKTTAPPGEQA
ncbi:MAG: LacI family transcriptional regulator [Phycisphaerae bacterium]|nr:LacI family transcriptional regulator [Phycisphaerae bacterium]